MIPTEVYILRQKTRPSQEECTDLFRSCLAQDEKRLLVFLNALTQLTQLQIRSANLNRETDDIDQQLEVFIKAEGGNRYVEDTAHFVLERFSLLSGDPPEQTRLAIAYAREAQPESNPNIPEVVEFLTRGRRWEELGHWGDALGCYYIGLVLHPNHPDLLSKLGRVQMRYSKYYSEAMRNLTKATELRPADGFAIAQLGRCYRLVANTPEIEVKGRPREDLRHMALGFLERAVTIRPEDPEIQAELQSLREELGVRSGPKQNGGFFS